MASNPNSVEARKRAERALGVLLRLGELCVRVDGVAMLSGCIEWHLYGLKRGLGVRKFLGESTKNASGTEHFDLQDPTTQIGLGWAFTDLEEIGQYDQGEDEKLPVTLDRVFDIDLPTNQSYILIQLANTPQSPVIRALVEEASLNNRNLPLALGIDFIPPYSTKIEESA